jgi:peptidoglycan/LPS O-acetylase OafA/YrhL
MPFGTQQAGQKRRSSLLTPFRRITSSGRFIAEIDGLRFIAILSVFIFHLGGTVATNSPPEQISSIQTGSLKQIVNTLDIGVPLFFVISGFILGLPFAEAAFKREKQVSLKRYFLRRVTRLEPPYVLCLLISLGLKAFSGRGLAVHLPHLMASMAYLHDAIFGYQSTITAVAWSLEIEVQFYILAPLFSLMFLIRNSCLRRVLLCVLIAVAIEISELTKTDLRLHLSVLGFAQFFLTGLLLIDSYLSFRLRSSWRWDVLSALGWPLLILLRWKTPTLSAWISPWLMFVLYAACFAGVLFRGLLTHPVITTIGGMCYSIYLLHNQLIYGFALITRSVLPASTFALRLATQFLLIGPAVLLVAAAYFEIIERPCMRPDWPRLLMLALRRKSVASINCAPVIEKTHS